MHREVRGEVSYCYSEQGCGQGALLLSLLFLPRKSTPDVSNRWLALYGALVTILCIAFGTFTQQLLVIRLFSSQAPSIAPGNIQRAQTWQNFSGNPAGVNGNLILILPQRLLLKHRQVGHHLW